MKLNTLTGFVLVILIFSMLPVPTAASTTASIAGADAYLTPYHQTWIDDFNSSTLDSRWTWVREDNNLWSLTANPGHMQITSSGSLFETVNSQKNVLLTPAPNGDYRITTRVQVSPTENSHGAALYVYQDDDNFIELARIYSDGANVRLRTEIAGVVWSSYVNVTQNNILLRIIKEGDVYYGWFSEDNGTTWEFVDQFSATLSDPKVGLSTRMGPTTTPVTADFDWIELETIIYNSEWKDGFDLPDLDSRWTWVREDDTLWSLTANPGYMQITSSGSLRETNNTQKNLLLTDAPNGDFRITTRVHVSPTENYHGAALYVYQDDDNFIELTRIYNNGPYVALRTEVAGVSGGSYVSVTQDNILLRIVKEGDDYFSWFSEDNGTTWKFVDQFSAALTNPKVGLGVRMGPTTTPLTADFDFIHFENYMEQIFLPLLGK